MGRPVDVFISYARTDRDLAARLAADLRTRRHTVWWDIEIKPTEDFEALIRRTLHSVKAAAVVWTPASIGSIWVKSEATTAWSRNVLVQAFLVDPKDSPHPFNVLHGIDLRVSSGILDLRPFVDAIEAQVRSSPDLDEEPIDTSTTGLQHSVTSSVEAAEEIGTIVRTIADSVPGLRGVADPHTMVQLDAVLSEVHATVRAVNKAVTLFLKPAIRRKPIDRDPGPYLELASRDLFAVIEEGRGHCGDISMIYFGRPEEPWPLGPTRPGTLRERVHQHLDATTARRLDDTFVQLQGADGDLFQRMNGIGIVLSDTARTVVRLLGRARPDDARALVLAAMEALEPLQEQVADRMRDIRKLQATLRTV